MALTSTNSIDERHLRRLDERINGTSGESTESYGNNSTDDLTENSTIVSNSKDTVVISPSSGHEVVVDSVTGEDEDEWKRLWSSFVGTYRIKHISIVTTSADNTETSSILEPPYTTNDEIDYNRRDRYQRGIDNEYIFRIFERNDDDDESYASDVSSNYQLQSATQPFRLSAELGEGNSFLLDFSIPLSDEQQLLEQQQQQTQTQTQKQLNSDSNITQATTRSSTKDGSGIHASLNTVGDLFVTNFQKTKAIPAEVSFFEANTLSIVQSFASIELIGSTIRLHGTNGTLEGTRLSFDMEYSSGSLWFGRNYYLTTTTIIGIVTIGYSVLLSSLI